MGETHSGGWTPAGLLLFISQGVTVVCPAAEEPTHVYGKGTEVSFVRVPWHLLLVFKGWEIDQRQLSLHRETLLGDSEKEETESLAGLDSNGYK